MKIGIIYCAYNCFSFASESIKPFIQAKKDNLISKISCVSVPFAEYFNIRHENDNTTEFLFSLEKQLLIDKVFDEPKYLQEHEARDLCLQYLRHNGCDLIWLVDGDEFYTQNDILNIIKFVEENPEYCWYSINFKNYIFDGKQWIDGFCPPRIFKSRFKTNKINSFFWDNDIVYEQNNEGLSYQNLSHLEIPRDTCHIKHLTWLHENGKLKYEYQIKHFGACSYKWNYEKNELEFDENFFLKNKIAKPNINID